MDAVRVRPVELVAVADESAVAAFAADGFELFEARTTRDARATAYLCRDFVCRLPCTDAASSSAAAPRPPRSNALASRRRPAPPPSAVAAPRRRTPGDLVFAEPGCAGYTPCKRSCKRLRTPPSMMQGARMAESRKSTLVLVAERAGVSIASVSRVLNGLPASAAAHRAGARGGGCARLRSRRDRAVPEGRPHRPDRVRRRRRRQPRLRRDDARGLRASSRRPATGWCCRRPGTTRRTRSNCSRSLNRGFVDGLLLSPLRVTEELVAALRSSRAADRDHRFASRRRRARQRARRLRWPAWGSPSSTSSSRAAGASRSSTDPSTPFRAPRASADTCAPSSVSGSRRPPTCRSPPRTSPTAGALQAAARLLGQSSPDAIVCANDLLAVATLKELASRGCRRARGHRRRRHGRHRRSPSSPTRRSPASTSAPASARRQAAKLPHPRGSQMPTRA